MTSKRRKKRPFDSLTLAYREELWARIGQYAEIEGECTIFDRHPSRNGYGRISIHGVLQAAHRFVYQYVHGALDASAELDHSCYNPACIRIKHLTPRTRSGNAKTRRSHGFHHPGTQRSLRW